MRRTSSMLVGCALVASLAMVPQLAYADTLGDLYGQSYDRLDVLDAGMQGGVADGLGDSDSSIKSVTPLSLSSEMLYFARFESGANYDAGLSSGDGYHAVGYYQFDVRYGLGSFMHAVYTYNPSKYAALAPIGERYGWDTTGKATRSGSSFTSFGNDINAAWHGAYAADPQEFSQLQNSWAYTNYFDGPVGIRGSLLAQGINIDKRSDCVKGLMWGISNLFGPGGGESYVRHGYYYGANWFIHESGINDAMSDEQMVTTLCDFIVNNVARRYPRQSIYWQGWQNRYRAEKDICLQYLSTPQGALFRMYNPNGGEHFYTQSKDERDMLRREGWNYEGYSCILPSDGSGLDMYRLYNPNGGQHHYTLSTDERDWLQSLGWIYEGVAFKSAVSGYDVHRMYNPNTGQHFYTASDDERDWLVSLGWNYEGNGWCATVV